MAALKDPRDPDVEGIAATMEEDPIAKKVCNAVLKKQFMQEQRIPENIDKDDIKAALEEVLTITLRVRRSYDFKPV